MMESVEQVLEYFARNIIPPSDQVYKDANVKMDKIFKLLQRKSKFSLDRFIVGGSATKHTSTQSFDYDCVVFINDARPKFKDVISEFEDILTMAELDIKGIKTTPYSVQFELNNVEFDLLIAANLVKGNTFSSSEQRIKEQQKRVIELLEKSTFHFPFDERKFNETKKMYSSSLVESHVEFMKKQDAFTHELARLAKFWNKTLFFDDYINGRSTIIELIAVEAALKTKAKAGKPDFVAGFKTFLDQMTKLDSIVLSFKTFWPEIKNEKLIRSYQGPIILEPNNPYNNIGVALKEPIREKFQVYAYETLNRMKQLTSRSLDQFFEPQPRAVVGAKLPTPKTFLVSVESDRKELSPSLTDRKKTSKRTVGEASVIRVMKDRLFTSTQTFTSRSDENLTTTNVKDFIKRVIDKNILNRDQLWVTTTVPHESHEYTVVVPYQNQNNGEVEHVVVSFDL